MRTDIKNLSRAITSSRLQQVKYLTEAYRSGHNEAVLKTVWRQRHGGSNPSASANKSLKRIKSLRAFTMKFVDTARFLGIENYTIWRKQQSGKRKIIISFG